MSEAAVIACMKPTGRSRVTNARLKEGKVNSRSLFAEADGRTPWARRFRDLVALFVDDAGGLSRMTELKLAIIRRAAALAVECERLEGELAEGRPIDVDAYARISSHLRRIAESIGLDRASRDVTPTLDEIISSTRAKRAVRKAPGASNDAGASSMAAPAPEKPPSALASQFEGPSMPNGPEGDA